MTSFVHTQYPTFHAGAERLESAAHAVQSGVKRIDSSRSLATLLLAAVVAALLVVANQLIDAVTDGHLLMAWVALWLVAFAAIGLLARPARHAARSLRTAFIAWRIASKEAAEESKLWELAKCDSRIMAEIQAARTRSTSSD